jgi:hypothetical protein
MLLIATLLNANMISVALLKVVVQFHKRNHILASPKKHFNSMVQWHSAK